MTNQPAATQDEKKVTTDLAQALKQAGQELARQISDASQLNVETFFTVIGENTKPEMVASTTIQLDGDTKMVIPLKRESGVLVRDLDLLELHQLSVDKALAYRARLFDQILEAARQARQR